MTETREETDGLAALHADVLTEEVLDSALLLRFAQTPERLDAAERSRVEAYLAESPAHRDELALLLRFAAAREQSVGSGAGDAEASAVPISAHPRWRPAAAALGLALAASVALALILGLPETGDAPLQVAEDTPSAPIEQPVHEEIQPPGAAEHPPEPLIAEAAAPLAQELEETLPTPEGVEPPALELAAEDRVSLPEPPALPPSGSAEPEPAPPEPILLAMDIRGPFHYAAPPGSTYLEPLGVLRNAGAQLPSLQALVPDHIAHTLSPSPTLYWFLSEGIEHAVEFVLSDSVSIDPTFEIRLEPPLAAGIHGLSLAEHGVELVVGEPYRWFVSLSPEHLTRGGVQRVAGSAELRARIDASPPGERGQVYAAAGLWYDALAFISAEIERQPDAPRLRALRAELLEQAGQRAAAAYDRGAGRAQGN